MRRFRFDIPATLVAEEHPEGPWVAAEEALHAVAAERERCAAILDDYIFPRPKGDEWANHVFRTIKGRIENPHRTLQEAAAQE